MSARQSADGPWRGLLRGPWLWISYAMCFAIGIPWYRTAGTLDDLVFGVPQWAVLSILSSVAISALTAHATLNLWDDGSSQQSQADEGSG